MSGRGRRPRSSEGERQRVVELVAEGASQREIAEVVFGDARFRGRVERILRASATASDASRVARRNGEDEVNKDDFHPDSDLALFRELISRAERSMLENTAPPLLSDIERLLRIKRQLDALEAVERARAIARGMS
jgi:hypothetical protein